VARYRATSGKLTFKSLTAKEWLELPGADMGIIRRMNPSSLVMARVARVVVYLQDDSKGKSTIEIDPVYFIRVDESLPASNLIGDPEVEFTIITNASAMRYITDDVGKTLKPEIEPQLETPIELSETQDSVLPRVYRKLPKLEGE